MIIETYIFCQQTTINFWQINRFGNVSKCSIRNSNLLWLDYSLLCGPIQHRTFIAIGGLYEYHFPHQSMRDPERRDGEKSIVTMFQSLHRRHPLSIDGCWSRYARIETIMCSCELLVHNCHPEILISKSTTLEKKSKAKFKKIYHIICEIWCAANCWMFKIIKKHMCPIL